MVEAYVIDVFLAKMEGRLKAIEAYLVNSPLLLDKELSMQRNSLLLAAPLNSLKSYSFNYKENASSLDICPPFWVHEIRCYM